MYEKPRVNVKVEPRSTFTFTFTSDLPYIVSNLFTHVLTHVKITRQWKSTLKLEFSRYKIEIYLP